MNNQLLLVKKEVLDMDGIITEMESYDVLYQDVREQTMNLYRTEARGFGNGYECGINKALELVQRTSILSPLQKKALWKEIKSLK